MQLAGESFELDLAKAVISGYCFHEVQSDLKAPKGSTFGVHLGQSYRRRWGYLSYDCQRGPGPAPDVVDVVAPVLLNVTQGYGVRLVSDLLAVCSQVRDTVGRIDPEFRFWDLDPSDVAPRGDPEARPESLALHQAWYLIESVNGAGVAVTHKLLHHAWPHLFPLIDNETVEPLGTEHAWLTILEDLKRYEPEFDELEHWFAEMAAARGGIPLTRLRLYDILLWCRVVGEEEEAAHEGFRFVKS